MTKHFSKHELARCFREAGRCSECRLTQPAMKLPYDIEDNLKGLATAVLEPVREKLGRQIVVNSGYRCPKHNLAVGGVVNSQHMKGEAADITAGSSEENQRLAEIIEANGKFDQMIKYLDKDGRIRFIHVSWKQFGPNRKQTLISKK